VNDPGAEAALPQMTFEEVLGRLEQVVEDLEGGQMPLEQALALFEEGMRLRAECVRRLQEAEARIEQVLADSAGEALPLEAEEA
jgi:exodeoxyribonuclease VII small subunit